MFTGFGTADTNTAGYGAGSHDHSSGHGLSSGTATSGLNSSTSTTGPNSGSVPAGYESTSGYGNNTGYDQSTSRGLGADSTQQGNHYTTTTTAGKLASVTGLGAASQVDNGSKGYSQDSTRGITGDDTTGLSGSSDYDSGSTHGLSGGKRSHLHGQGLGSDRSFGKSSDRYLFDRHSAPGSGGRGAYNADDFTDANIHHQGSGHSITGELGSDVNSGKASGAAGNPGAGISSATTSSTAGRSRKPGFDRQSSGLGSSNYGLNSGKSREGLGQKVERKAEEYAPAAGLAGAGAGAGAHGASHSGREPLSGVQGSGVGGEPYDQGNAYDGAAASQTTRSEPLSSQYGQQDSRVSQATSGIGAMNLNDKQRGANDGAYDVTNAGGYTSGNQTSSTTTTGVPFPGGAAATAGNTTGSSTGGANYGATAPRDASSSAFAGTGTSTGSGSLKDRVAGAPDPTSAKEECEAGHHNAHPVGEAAHEDGSHKPTFLNYQNDTFGVPVAKPN